MHTSQQLTRLLRRLSCLLDSLFLLFPPAATADVAVQRVKPGDQAPATASTQAAEGGEEEQGADQHRRYSGSRGNENKGSGTHCDSQVGRFFPRSKNYKGIIYMESKLIPPLSQQWQNVLLISLNHHAKPIFSPTTLSQPSRSWITAVIV